MFLRAGLYISLKSGLNNIKFLFIHQSHTLAMISVGASKRLCTCSSKTGAQLNKAVTPLLYQLHATQIGLGYPATLRVASVSHPPRQPSPSSTRNFSTTPSTQLRDIFPRKESELIRQTPPAWPHHGYTQEEMDSVVPAHRKPETASDWVAWKLVRFCRWWMDLATGLRSGQQVDKRNPTTAVAAERPLTEAQWLGELSSSTCVSHWIVRC